MRGGVKDSIRTSPTDCDILLIPPAEKTGSCVDKREFRANTESERDDIAVTL